MLERNQERLKLDNGVIVEVYLKPRSRRFYNVLVTFPDGSTKRSNAWASMTGAWEWGLATAKGTQP